MSSLSTLCETSVGRLRSLLFVAPNSYEFVHHWFMERQPANNGQHWRTFQGLRTLEGCGNSIDGWTQLEDDLIWPDCNISINSLDPCYQCRPIPWPPIYHSPPSQKGYCWFSTTYSSTHRLGNFCNIVPGNLWLILLSLHIHQTHVNLIHSQIIIHEYVDLKPFVLIILPTHPTHQSGFPFKVIIMGVLCACIE